MTEIVQTDIPQIKKHKIYKILICYMLTSNRGLWIDDVF